MCRVADPAGNAPLLEAADALARKRLSERRYGHTVRVADTVEGLAQIHSLDPNRTRLAALLHDAARETEPEDYLRLADEWGLAVGEPERKSPKLLHGPVAAELARRELGVEDEEVLEAIRVHTVGAAGIGALALALYRAWGGSGTWPERTSTKPQPSRCGAPSATTRGVANPSIQRAARC